MFGTKKNCINFAGNNAIYHRDPTNYHVPCGSTLKYTWFLFLLRSASKRAETIEILEGTMVYQLGFFVGEKRKTSRREGETLRWNKEILLYGIIPIWGHI